MSPYRRPGRSSTTAGPDQCPTRTSTGVTADVAAIGAAIDRTGHPGLLFVDTVSPAATRPVCHDDWGVDVTVMASQKGFLLPPGLAMLAAASRLRRPRPVGDASHAAGDVWGLEQVPKKREEGSVALMALLLPDGADEVALRRHLERAYGLTLGGGLGRLAGRSLRIGHLGDLDDLTLVAVLAGIELGLPAASLPIHRGGVDAAMSVLAQGNW